MFVLALVATAWWLMRRDRMVWAGIALALATTLKPQVVLMVPICLLAAGRLTAKPLITHQLPLNRVHEAIEVLEKRIGDPVKVVLNP